MSEEPDLFGGALPTAPAAPRSAALYLSQEPAIGIAFGADAVAALSGSGLRDVIAERLAHINQRGHTLADDRDRGARYLAHLARDDLQIAFERLEALGDRRDPQAARKRLVTGAALAIAALDALDTLFPDRSPPLPPEGFRTGFSPAGPDGGADPGTQLHRDPPADEQSDDYIFDQGEDDDV